jgi:hypothetical protein
MARDQGVDAYMTVGPLKSKITVDAINATAAARGEPKFLPIEVSEAIAQKHPLYESEEIPGSIFNSSPARPEDKVETVSVNHLIIAPKQLSDTAVGAFARQLFTVRQQLARELPTAAQIEKPDTDKDAALPAHQGAAAYIDGNERTFLENMPTTSGSPFSSSPASDLRGPGCNTTGNATSASNIPSIATICSTCLPGRAGPKRRKSSRRCRARPTAFCARRSTATTMARSRKAICP